MSSTYVKPIVGTTLCPKNATFPKRNCNHNLSTADINSMNRNVIISDNNKFDFSDLEGSGPTELHTTYASRKLKKMGVKKDKIAGRTVDRSLKTGDIDGAHVAPLYDERPIRNPLLKGRPINALKMAQEKKTYHKCTLDVKDIQHDNTGLHRRKPRKENNPLEPEYTVNLDPVANHFGVHEGRIGGGIGKSHENCQTIGPVKGAGPKTFFRRKPETVGNMRTCDIEGAKRQPPYTRSEIKDPNHIADIPGATGGGNIPYRLRKGRVPKHWKRASRYNNAGFKVTPPWATSSESRGVGAGLSDWKAIASDAAFTDSHEFAAGLDYNTNWRGLDGLALDDGHIPTVGYVTRPIGQF